MGRRGVKKGDVLGGERRTRGFAVENLRDALAGRDTTLALPGAVLHNRDEEWARNTK
jgi:hypothetical protein